MESLAILVFGLMLISLLSGPIAVLLTRFKSENLLLTILRRFIQALLMLLGFLTGFQFLTSSVPLQIQVVGLFAILTNYIALRREYFPTFFVLNSLKIPVPKWSFWRSPRSSNRGRGNIDGNGPSGQS